MTVIDCISRKQFGRGAVEVCLNSLAIVFSFNEVWVREGLEVVYVLFPRKHRADRVEEGNLVV
jgi:hypothetical protein